MPAFRARSFSEDAFDSSGFSLDVGTRGYVQLKIDGIGKKAQGYENTIQGNTVEAITVHVVDPTGYNNSFVTITEGPDKKVQYFQNTIDGHDVHSLALVMVDTAGDPI